MAIKKYDDLVNNFINKSSDTKGLVQDPLMITFSLRFDFFSRLGNESFSMQPGLLNGDARRYLSNNGDTLRVQKLDYFVSLLRTITVEEPWTFSELSGVETLMTLDTKKGFRNNDSSKLTITALETIDMRTLSFMEAYRSIVYDKVYMRQVLPKSLRMFDMSVAVIDPRILKKIDKDGKLVYDDDSQGVIVLKLEDCEFDFNSYSFLSSLNHNPTTTISHKFDIKVGRVYETYNLPTKILFGYGGLGYFSDDKRPDYNPLSSILRPKTGNMAEVNNGRKILDDDLIDVINDNKLEPLNINLLTPEQKQADLNTNTFIDTNVDNTLFVVRREFTSNEQTKELTPTTLKSPINRQPRTIL
jgi:hypothetical protein